MSRRGKTYLIGSGRAPQPSTSRVRAFVEVSEGSTSKLSRERRHEPSSPNRWTEQPVGTTAPVGLSDPYDAEFHTEESGVLVSASIQPVDSRSMLGSKRCGNPDDRRGFGPGRVGEDLAEVAVVGGLELTLNDHDFTGGLIAPIRSKLNPPTGCSATSSARSIPSKSLSTSTLLSSQV